ncbi:DUF58 domain-containing protein [Amphibacillus xylanus]|uniref:DUF58 domain-containing protein n=1 Tax=Amphibacillus xylanus (strain ATCC 51415 / DSM 6626 / JCM 7361 / LMG 17667 / NBRC 15112 / Ep01) TaxID=698758 RepID=K0J3Q6_AMPXN|nr:DUF58 domain-containing protein [Amphibacillus xylanus]BAM47792.1 hypothetical protein AXY_16600 [Amphibacillus xylanus NBRC 15112]
MNIAWLIALLIISIFGQGYIYSKWGLNKISYKRQFDQSSVFVGQKVILVDEVVNKKLLPLPWVRLESKMDYSIKTIGESQFDSSDLDVHRTLLSLLPYQKLTRRHHLICTKRGVFELDTIALTLGDVFGFIEQFRSFETDAKIIVYPQILRKDDLTIPSQIFLGEQTVKRWIIEDPFISVGTRDYLIGDNIKQINWKASARTKNIQVKVNDHTADREVVILVNADQSEDIWLPISNLELFEKTLSYAATVAHYLESNGEAYSFSTNAVDKRKAHESNRSFVKVEANSGTAHFYHLLTQIAYLIPKRSRHIKYLLDEYVQLQSKRADILLITPIITNEILEKVNQLRAAGHSVVIDHVTIEAQEGVS